MGTSSMAEANDFPRNIFAKNQISIIFFLYLATKHFSLLFFSSAPHWCAPLLTDAIGTTTTTTTTTTTATTT